MRRLLCAAALVVACASLARAEPLTAAEKRGRKIYLTGEKATAIIAGASELPASSVPCGSCHGADGRGVAEGTIAPADVRWSVLAQPRLAAPIRPRYDEALIRRAVSSGIDSGGRRLAPVMPRYRLHDDDLADLVAYLQRLGAIAEPGLSASEIVIATAVPLSGPHGRVGEITRAVLAGVFDDVNAAGGIYGRMLRLEAIDSASAARLDTDAFFAMLCASSAPPDPDERVPVVTPFRSGAADATSFFLYPDLESEALALAKSVAASDGPPPSRRLDRRRLAAGDPLAITAYIAADGSAAAAAAAAAIEHYGASEQWRVRRFPAAETTKSDDDVVFLLGRADLPGIVRRLDELDWHPRILVAGTTPAPELFDAKNKISVAVAALPTDVDAAGQRELATFAARHRLPREQPATQIATYASAKVLIEALQRAGRDLTRERLIAALEGFYRFPTGLTPPITFTRDRHIGAPDAHVVSLDGAARP